MRKLRLAWGTMGYSDTGGVGTPLVLLHGTGCDSADWDGVVDRLPPGLRVIRMDFRGHGRSDAGAEPLSLDDLSEDVLAAAGRLGLEEAILVGHSLGGMVAMDVARRSSLAIALVLLEGWTRSAASEAFAGDRTFGALDGPAVREIERKLSETVARFAPEAWKRLEESGARFDALGYLEASRIPIAEVYGDKGRTNSTRRGLMIPDKPNIEVIWIPGAGHYLPHERPADVATIIAETAGRAQPPSS